MRSTLALSDGPISELPRSWRLRLVDILVRMWLLKACLCLKPVAVFRKRFAAPLLVFIFGMFSTPHSLTTDNHQACQCPGGYLRFLGAMTIISWRPSSLGCCSTVPS